MHRRDAQVRSLDLPDLACFKPDIRLQSIRDIVVCLEGLLCCVFILCGAEIRVQFREGQTKWDKPVSAKIGSLQKSVVFCEDLHLRNAIIIPRKSENWKNQINLRKTANLAPFVPFRLSLLVPLEMHRHFLKTSQGSGTSRQNCRDIPGTKFFPWASRGGKELCREGTNFYPPPGVEDPHPTGRPLDPKS